MKIEVKICGITRMQDAEAAMECGADYIGLIFVPYSKRYLAPERAGQFASLAVKKAGVFADADLDFIRRMVETARLDVVQLHGGETGDFARKIDFAEVWKAGYDADFPAARLVCDAVRGGSGQFGDHRRAAELAKVRKIMLAGGVTPENAVELIRKVRPAGIDLAGGVELSPGMKDREKIKRLFNNIKEARL